MKLSDFDYHLPTERIAQEPLAERDQSRLLVLDKKGAIVHQQFFNILDHLQSGDVLVLNNSKVIPARLLGKKMDTGGKVEVFLSKKQALNKEGEVWECLLKGKNLDFGSVIELGDELVADVLQKHDDIWLVEFNKVGQEFIDAIEKIGHTPLPPYIKKEATDKDKISYQTVYAEDDKKGSVAAPTAGLHFTSELLEKIKDKGIEIVYLTLHVGLGTFLPVKVDDIASHKMHSEWVEIKKEEIEKIVSARKSHHKVVAVGTTACRSLEAIWQNDKLDQDFADWVDIFIYPGYEFKIVNSLITNFHLPKSTLLMLVSALAGKKNIDKAYQEAIEQEYRFYSYGDAMMIC